MESRTEHQERSDATDGLASENLVMAKEHLDSVAKADVAEHGGGLMDAVKSIVDAISGFFRSIFGGTHPAPEKLQQLDNHLNTNVASDLANLRDRLQDTLDAADNDPEKVDAVSLKSGLDDTASKIKDLSEKVDAKLNEPPVHNETHIHHNDVHNSSTNVQNIEVHGDNNKVSTGDVNQNQQRDITGDDVLTTDPMPDVKDEVPDADEPVVNDGSSTEPVNDGSSTEPVNDGSSTEPVNDGSSTEPVVSDDKNVEDEPQSEPPAPLSAEDVTTNVNENTQNINVTGDGNNVTTGSVNQNQRRDG